MSNKKLVAVMVAVLALTAVAASSASAAVETKAAEWYTGATLPGTTLAGDLAVTATGTLTLAGTIGGTGVGINAPELECVGCQITNAEVTSKAGKIAIARGQIRLKNVSVEAPANCTAQGINADGSLEALGTITSRPLVIHADWRDTNTANKKNFAQFLPVTGSIFFSVHIAGTICGLAGNYNSLVRCSANQSTTQKSRRRPRKRSSTPKSSPQPVQP